MPPSLIVDIDNIDMSQVIFDRSDIEQYIPQAYEMAQFDGILWHDPENLKCLGYKDITENEFWVRGHIPGRPIMPGVIMIEAAAQISSYYMKKFGGVKGFLGFAGIEYAKFRGTVEPGCRLLLLGQILKVRSRQFTSQVQGIVDGKMVFDTVIAGMNV